MSIYHATTVTTGDGFNATGVTRYNEAHTGTADPAGATKQLQYNDAGAMAGDADLAWDKTLSHLEVGVAGAQGAVCFGINAADEVSEASELIVYAKSIGGRAMPKWIGPSGVDTPFQPFFGFNKIAVAYPGTGTTAATAYLCNGAPITNTGTMSQVSMSTGTAKKNSMNMTGMAVVTTNTTVGCKSTNYEAKIAGGFFLSVRFGIGNTATASQKGFHGLWGSTTLAANVDALTVATNRLGIGYSLNASGVGNLFIVAGNGTTSFTAVDLGNTSFAVNVSNIFEFVMFCAPGASSVSYRVTNLETGAAVTGTISGNIPASTVIMAVQHWVVSATITTSVMLLNKWYLETDY